MAEETHEPYKDENGVLHLYTDNYEKIDNTNGEDQKLLVGDYNGNDSAIKKLFEIIQGLNNQAHDRAGDISFAGFYLHDVADVLAQANATIGAGWDQVADFLDKLDKKLQETLASLIVEMNKYAAKVDSGELEAGKAVQDSNKVLNGLLDELNSL